MEYNSQKTEENQTTVMKNINENSIVNIISEENKNKNKISKKLLIIMGIAIGLIILSVIVIIVVLVNKKEEKHYNIKNDLNNDTVISSDTSKGDETDETSNSDEIDKISIDYDNAKKLIDSEVIEENHNL